MSIAENCMVVNLQVGLWKGHRLDKDASRRITEEAGAVDDAARVNKHLIAKDVLKPIETAASAIRTHFYDRTLPWKDNGDRLLTRVLYMGFIEQHEKLVGGFHMAVDHFVRAAYPAAREQAEFRMGDLFNPNDYPSGSELARRFYVHLDIDPVATSGDFRVDLDRKQVAKIKRDMEASLKERMAKAMQDVWERLAKTLSHFAAKMGSDEIFRDSTVRNLEEIVELLPALNVLNDRHLEKIRKDIISSLHGFEPQDLRTDPAKRELAASEATRIMEDMKGFMAAFGGK